MREILDGRLKRQLKILEILWETQWVTTAELAEMIESSEKTTRNDLSQINEMIEPLTIETSFRSGVLLKKNLTTPKAFIYSKILSKSLEYTLLETLFFRKVSSKDDLSDSLYISETQVSRIINRINQVISKYDFKINNHLEIVGNEGNIRDFFSAFFAEKYNLPENMMETKDISLITDIIEVFVKENTIWALVNNDNHLFLGNMKFHLFICFIQLKQGYNLLSWNVPFIFQHFANETELLGRINKNFAVHLKEEDLQQLFYEFYQPIHPTLRLQYLNVEVDAVDQKNKINKVIGYLEKQFGVVCENRDQLTHDIYWTTMNTVKPTYILHNKKKEFYLNVKRDSSTLVKDLEDRFFEIYQSLGPSFHIYIDEMIHQSVFKLLTSWSDLWIQVRKQKVKLHVALLLDSSYDHMRMLKEEIQFYFRHNIDIEILNPATKIQNGYLQKFDCVLTDIYSNDFFEVPTLGISNYLDEAIINKLVDYYHIKVDELAEI
ncbi:MULTISPECIES: helix-turn-helix domain-containing protein [unclassified Enterococcus]|uniref:helix-turn-helix domain-containing protein n=1 Tax=unclassified Enterococcus TaxID=2608891 RepID=UPI001A9B61DC|nr:helix-turn-helix domain-containing protein [Enterococcus sp. DIV1271a]MBO1301345.1 helix-turn-helix domain-containing protein [Enterococcus sp. DIV1271a]